VFPVVILALLAVGMVGHLVLQTRIQELGFELGALQAQEDQLSAQQAILSTTLAKQSTPQQLAYAASSLGMVANPYSTFLTLPTGQVTGTNQVVRGGEVPIISAPPAIIAVSPVVDLNPDTGTSPVDDAVPPDDAAPVAEAAPADAAGADAAPADAASQADAAPPVDAAAPADTPPDATGLTDQTPAEGTQP